MPQCSHHLIDLAINDALRTVTGCLCSKPAENAGFYPPHTNSSVHLTTSTEVWRSGRINDGMPCAWRTLRDSILSSPTSAPTLLEWPCLEQRGSGLTSSAQVSDVSTPAYKQMSMTPSASWEWGAEEQTVGHVVPQSPTSPWIARSDGSGWRDNRMAAQHLIRDLVWRSSGLKELLIRWRRRITNVLAL